ncbi:suppressor of glycerol defect [Sporothrix epigloea]|uniref:Suppressor of glycerol defect n=1 Tax=Sporothrix epigloea TaxID=1892477 RepID=A0ABP0E2I0_9PEZI
MAPSRAAGPSLSAGLLKQLGIEPQGASSRVGRQKHSRYGQRRDSGSNYGQQQRSGRVQKPSVMSRPTQQPHRSKPDKPDTRQTEDKAKNLRVVNPELEDDSVDEDDFDSFSDEDTPSSQHEADVSAVEEGSHATVAGSSKISRRMREQLEHDDAEIAELERKLGMKGRKNLPQLFKDEGLGDLLESLSGPGSEDAETLLKKKRKNEAEEWLRSKRRKAMGLGNETAVHAADSASDDCDNDDEDSDIFDDSEAESADFEGFNTDEEVDSERHQSPNNESQQPKRVRENPYVAPVTASSASQKYVPPALRKAQQATDPESEVVARVRRQAHHLIARLSDANLLTILGDVEKMYLDNPRQYVTDAVTDKLLEQVQTAGALSNNVTVLIAGFATAIYMVKGTDFGANFIQQNATLFKTHYSALTELEANSTPDRQKTSWTPSSKIAINLLSLMAELCNFRMIGPNLIYDYVQMLLTKLTETNTELLLRVFEICGRRLHQEDPRALKNVVSLIQPAVLAAGGEEKLSVRTKHMIDRISEIRKSDKKKQRDAENSGFGHAERIRKVLGNLPTSRKLEATGPLRVSLADMEKADKRGKWWLVGASWAGRDGQTEEEDAATKGKAGAGAGAGDVTIVKRNHQTSTGDDGKDDVIGSWGDDIADVDELDLLAREQGMNTNARRSIFVALLSAADSKDAHARLLRLGLNKYEKREIANVLIRCVGSEQHYNRYYALVARQVCSTDRRMAWVVQASVWKLFRRMGEPMFGELPEDGEPDEEDEATDLRRVINTAKLCGFLIACGSLNLEILKCLNLMRLQTKTRVFVEVLLLSFFEEAQKLDKTGGSSSSSSLIRRRFGAASESNDLRRGLQYFIEKVVQTSKLVEAHQVKDIVKLCNRAQKALRDTRD